VVEAYGVTLQALTWTVWLCRASKYCVQGQPLHWRGASESHWTAKWSACLACGPDPSQDAVLPQLPALPEVGCRWHQRQLQVAARAAAAASAPARTKTIGTLRSWQDKRQRHAQACKPPFDLFWLPIACSTVLPATASLPAVAGGRIACRCLLVRIRGQTQIPAATCNSIGLVELRPVDFAVSLDFSTCTHKQLP